MFLEDVSQICFPTSVTHVTCIIHDVWLWVAANILLFSYIILCPVTILCLMLQVL